MYREEVDALMSKQSTLAIDEADMIFFVVDGRSGITGVDQNLAIGNLRKINKPLYLIVNKIDGLDEEQVCAEFSSLGFSAIYCISATHGRGVGLLLKHVTANFCATRERCNIR
jgi:GTP-binding protein